MNPIPAEAANASDGWMVESLEEAVHVLPRQQLEQEGLGRDEFFAVRAFQNRSGKGHFGIPQLIGNTCPDVAGQSSFHGGIRLTQHTRPACGTELLHFLEFRAGSDGHSVHHLNGDLRGVWLKGGTPFVSADDGEILSASVEGGNGQEQGDEEGRFHGRYLGEV
jgi:hypothetical protein